MTNLITLLGRVFLALIFLLSGISKIGAYSGTVAYMHAQGIPAAPFFLYAAVLVEILGGLSILVGYRARIGALLLLGFLIPTTFIFHFKPAFYANMQVEDQMQLIQVLKNLAIMGGLLMICGNGAGKLIVGKDH